MYILYCLFVLRAMFCYPQFPVSVYWLCFGFVCLPFDGSCPVGSSALFHPVPYLFVTCVSLCLPGGCYIIWGLFLLFVGFRWVDPGEGPWIPEGDSGSRGIPGPGDGIPFCLEVNVPRNSGLDPAGIRHPTEALPRPHGSSAPHGSPAPTTRKSCTPRKSCPDPTEIRHPTGVLPRPHGCPAPHGSLAPRPRGVGFVVSVYRSHLIRFVLFICYGGNVLLSVMCPCPLLVGFVLMLVALSFALLLSFSCFTFCSHSVSLYSLFCCRFCCISRWLVVVGWLLLFSG